MERFTSICAASCTHERCGLPVEALNPLISAENVCRGALEESQPRRRLPLASSLIEQALESHDIRLLNQAENVIQSVAEDPLDRYRALIYNGYLSLFAARVEDRYPDEEDLIDSFGRMQSGIDMYASYFDLSENERAQLIGRDVENDGYVTGAAGEALTLYISLYGAMSHGKTLLYPSSYREDNPPNPSNAKLHKELTHDVHTFDPSAQRERQIFSVKATSARKKSGTALKIKPLVLASNAYNELLGTPPHETVSLTMPEVLGFMRDAQRKESSGHLFGTAFREHMSRGMERIITSTPPIRSTY